jgi:hypothetical protein
VFDNQRRQHRGRAGLQPWIRSLEPNPKATTGAKAHHLALSDAALEGPLFHVTRRGRNIREPRVFDNNADNTVEERRFSAALSPPKQNGL